MDFCIIMKDIQIFWLDVPLDRKIAFNQNLSKSIKKVPLKG